MTGSLQVSPEMTAGHVVHAFMLSAANTLASRRDEMSKKFFLDISETTSCLHHLLPDPRDHAIISRLRTNENRPLLECSLVYGNRG